MGCGGRIEMVVDARVRCGGVLESAPSDWKVRVRGEECCAKESRDGYAI